MANSTKQGSFVTDEGELNVILDLEEITWFEFYWFSRAMPSPAGGWDFREYWWERGVQKLAEREFIKKWTENSLDQNVLPRPRTNEFKFDRNPKDRSRLGESLKLRASLDEATEHELNYGLFNGGFGIKLPDGIRPLGYEIPLAKESDGQLKVDLFGVSTRGPAIEIVELKKANNENNSPLLALTEAICYALQTLRCMDALLKEEQLKEHRKAFEQINITILAPARYWGYWSARDGLDRNLIQDKLGTIVKYVEVGIQSAGCFPNFRKLELDLKDLEPATPSLEGP